MAIFGHSAGLPVFHRTLHPIARHIIAAIAVDRAGLLGLAAGSGALIGRWRHTNLLTRVPPAYQIIAAIAAGRAGLLEVAA